MIVQRPQDVLPPWLGGIVAVDTETSGLFVDDGARVAIVSVAWEERGQVRSAAFPFDQGPRDKSPVQELSFDDDPNLGHADWEWLMAWLGEQWLCTHNAKFDLHHLRQGTRHWAGRDLVERVIADTMLRQRAIDPAGPIGLKEVAAALWGDDETEAKDALAPHLGRKSDPRYDLAPWAVIGPYAAKDAEQCLRLWAWQEEVMEGDDGLRRQAQRKQATMRALYGMERRGVAYDVEASRAAARDLQARATWLRQQMPFPPTVPGAKRFFYDEQGYTPIKTTALGAPQLDDESIAELVAKGAPWAVEYAEYQRTIRAISMWYEGYAEATGEDGRLRTSYRQTAVRTGRMSVERVQLQAIPKDDKGLPGVPPVKQLFRGGPGKALWNLDLSQAELRVATKYAGCRRMLALLEEGADLHGITCSQIFRIQEGHPDWKTKRDIAKRLTFGGIFQIGPATFQSTLSKAAGIRLSIGECKEIVYGWRDLYPEFGIAYDRSSRQAERHGYVRLMPGTSWEERSYFGPRDFTNSGWSRVVQGSLALANALLLAEVEQRWPDTLVLNVHDSLVLEVEQGEAGAEVALDVARWAGRYATGLFGIEMRMDLDRWKTWEG